jgi:hypothetical protein
MRALLTALLLTLPALAVAQMIYKVQTPDGAILFTDTPPPGSKVLEERSARPTPKVSGGAPGSPGAVTTQRPPVVPSTVGPMPQPMSGPGLPPGARSPVESAMQEVNSAEAALAVARRRLETGREPLPGERLGLAGGGSRLSPEYEARIAALERDIVEAEARVQKAYSARNTAR